MQHLGTAATKISLREVGEILKYFSKKYISLGHTKCVLKALQEKLEVCSKHCHCGMIKIGWLFGCCLFFVADIKKYPVYEDVTQLSSLPWSCSWYIVATCPGYPSGITGNIFALLLCLGVVL